MSTTVQRLQTELAKLNEPERAALAHFLIRSLQDGTEDGAEQAWDAELERRGRELRTGRATGEPADQVFSELRAKYGH